MKSNKVVCFPLLHKYEVFDGADFYFETPRERILKILYHEKLVFRKMADCSNVSVW